MVRFGVFEVDRETRELRKKGRKVRLQEKPFELLCLLTDRPGEIVTRDEVREHLWPSDTFVEFDDSINSAIKRLRTALGDSASNPRFVETVPRQGFRFVAPVSRDDVPGPEPAAAPGSRRSRVSTLALAALTGATVVAGVLFWFRPSPTTDSVAIGRLTQLTRDDGLEVDPAISPDGRMIAFASGAFDQMAIFVQQMDGGGRIRLGEDLPGTHRWPQWSPDGSRIAFQVSNEGMTDIYIVPALGGEPRRVVAAETGPLLRGFAFSPDGERVAYVAGVDRNELKIQSLEAGGRGSTTLVRAFEIFPLSWSPDGSKIAYASGNVGYSRGHDVTNRAPSSIWVISVDGGEPVRVTPDPYMDHSPVWTPDGRHLLFVSDRTGGRDIYRVRLDEAGQPVAEPERLTTGLQVHTISVSSDGSRLAYSVLINWQNVWRMPIPAEPPVSAADSTAVTRGNQVIEGTDVAPGGDVIAFDSNRSGNQDIYKMAVGGGEPEQLTTDAGEDFVPHFSPSGRRIAFHSYRDGNRNIYTMSTDGRELRQLTNDPAQDRRADWSPDAKQLVFQSDRAGRQELFIVSAENGELEGATPRKITSDGGIYATWSPDGRWIAYHHSPYTEDAALAVISPEGSEPRILLRHDSSSTIYAAWAPDSKTVYYSLRQTNRGASLWSIPVEGGEPTLLVKDDHPVGPIRFEFVTDGADFFFSVAERESDIWSMELTAAPAS